MNSTRSVNKAVSSELSDDDKKFADQLNSYLESRDLCNYEMGRHIL